MLKTILLYVSLAGIVKSQFLKLEEKEYKIGYLSGAFGWFPGVDETEIVNKYKERCVECLGRKDNFYVLKEACNLYITCVSLGNTVYMYGGSCGATTMKSSTTEQCVYFPGREEATKELNCTNPCLHGTKFPVDATRCGKYYTCEYNEFGQPVFNLTECDEPGHGFNVNTGECDWKCPDYKFTEKEVNVTCEAADDNDHYKVVPLIETTGSDGKKRYRQGRARTQRCAYSTEHLRKDACQCDKVIIECQDVTSLRLSSVDNTWNRALNNTPADKTSAIDGNATVTGVTDEFPKSALFTQRSVFMAPGLTQNDLGLRFAFSFDFLARTAASDYRASGVVIPNDGLDLNDVALADNSNCDYKPTYGCKFNVTRSNRGNVVCYVKPHDVDVEDHREVASPELDLTKRITVYFAKDDTMGELRVTEEGRRDPYTMFITFPKDVRATGNRCPLTLGSGTDKRYFSGYMDNMLLVKPCKSFLQPING